jgi:proline iminopeptidase
VAVLVTSDGVQLFYDRHGRGRRVFVCGGGPANDHRYMADDLAPMADELELVYHDYRGSGQSAAAPPNTYTFARLAADLDELRSHLGEEKIVVLGHSMGGFVALTYALLYPDRCERLVLVGVFPTAIPRQMLPPTFRALGWARSTKMAARAVWWLVNWSWRPRTEERKRRLYAIWSTMQEGLPAVRAREAERERRLGLPLANDNIRPLQREVTSLNLIDRLPTVACPTLVLYGDRDAAAVWSGRVFRQNLPDVDCVVLSDIGHDPFFEAPAASAAALRAVLR